MPFCVNWLLVNELAIGSSPQHDGDVEILVAEGLRAVLSLCAHEEAPPPRSLKDRLGHDRLVLPDHRVGRDPEIWELDRAVARLAALREQGPVYLHCAAGIERSPLVAIGWLMHSRGISLQAALDYVQQLHPPTSPLPGQLAALRRWAAAAAMPIQGA